MRSNFSAKRIMLAAAVAFAGTIVGVETSAANASAAMNGAPVSVNEHLVTVNKGATTARFYHRFTNQGAVSADVVRFTVYLGSGNKPQTITETGTFSPGVGIDREHNLASYLFGSSRTPSCTVNYVHFTDGTSWTAPSSQ